MFDVDAICRKGFDGLDAPCVSGTFISQFGRATSCQKRRASATSRRCRARTGGQTSRADEAVFAA